MRARHLLGLAGGSLAALSGWLLLGPAASHGVAGERGTCIACGERTVLVRGRLEDADTGAPLADAYVLTLALAEWAREPETIAMYRREGEQHPGRPELCAVGRTDPWGHFRVLVSEPVSETTVDGVVQNPTDPDPRGCLQALWIETSPGATPIVTPVAGGTWFRFDYSIGPRGPYFGTTWDLGEIKVRRPK